MRGAYIQNNIYSLPRQLRSVAQQQAEADINTVLRAWETAAL